MVIVLLGAFWFGVKAGILLGFVSTGIYCFELWIYSSSSLKEILLNGSLFRLGVYISGSILLGYLLNKNRIIKKQLKQESYYDQITGCINDRWIINVLEKEIERSKRTHNKFSIIMLNLDSLLKINDQFGYSIRNQVLSLFASIIMQNIRNADSVGRFKENNFLIVLPGLSPHKAHRVIERIQNNLLHLDYNSMDLDNSLSSFLTFNVGIACYPVDAVNTDDLLFVIKQALSKEKMY